MDQKICLDTDVVIAILNDDNEAEKLLEDINDFFVYIPVITLFELLLRETNLDKIEIFRSKVNVLNFDESASRMSSSIFKYLRKQGNLIDYRDLFIAAICITNNCSLLTFNKKHFEKISELRLLEI